MKRTLGLSAYLILALGIIPGAMSQTSQGELEEVDYRAPEFPLPAQPLPPPPTYNPSMSAPQAVPQGAGPGAAPRMGAALPQPTAAPMPSQQATPSQAGPSSTGITWINSPRLTMTGLRGTVVMIDFWEYTCINCIRTLPENKKWYERYHRDGFEIIGVHDPEFDIAYSVKNVREAVKRLGIHYPVVVDDRFMIWNLYHSDSWPNRFLIDAKGNVRYHRVGEGGDAAFEQAIQKLLQEAHPGLKFPVSDVIPPEEHAFAPSCGIPTPEMYVGDWFGRGILANPEGYNDGKVIDYRLPDSVEDGHVALEGRWKTDKNGMTYRGKKMGAGELEMRYHARELYSVMNVAHGRPAHLEITQDGKDLTRESQGADVRFDSQGHSYIEVREPRMYYLVRNPAFGSHSIVLKPAAPGITVNSFTFGNNCQVNFAHL